MNGALLAIDTERFLAGCEVKPLEGEEAQAVVAAALGGDDLALEQAS